MSERRNKAPQNKKKRWWDSIFRRPRGRFILSRYSMQREGDQSCSIRGAL